MNAIEYIKSSLSSIAARIPEIGLRYAFDPVTSFHIIEVYPESIRRGNEQYMEQTRVDVKPSLWQRIKNSKVVRAISYIMKIKVVVEVPNALPEGRGE